MSATTSAAPSAAPCSASAAAGRDVGPAELSRVVLRRPKGNRRVVAQRRLPTAKQAFDACGRALRRSTPALVGLAVVCAFSGAAAGSYRWVTTSPRFEITAIELRGNRTLTDETIADLLPVRTGDNIFSVATSAVERALAKSPWISSATVHRELPHRLVVTVSERSAAALVDLGGLYLVEADGHPFKRASVDTGEADGLTVISGLERLAFRDDPGAAVGLIREALATLERWRAQPGRPAVAELSFDGYRGVTLHLASGLLAVHLGVAGDAAQDQRMALFASAWSALSDEERARARAIYLDAGPGQATVAFAKD